MKPKKVKIIKPKPPKPVKPTEIKIGSIVTGRYESIFYPGTHGELVSIDETKCVVVSASPIHGLIVQRYSCDDDDEQENAQGPECFVQPKHLQLHEESPEMIAYDAACESYYDEHGYDDD